jgi:hypothetical protein
MQGLADGYFVIPYTLGGNNEGLEKARGMIQQLRGNSGRMSGSGQ